MKKTPKHTRKGRVVSSLAKPKITIPATDTLPLPLSHHNACCLPVSHPEQLNAAVALINIAHQASRCVDCWRKKEDQPDISGDSRTCVDPLLHCVQERAKRGMEIITSIMHTKKETPKTEQEKNKRKLSSQAKRKPNITNPRTSSSPSADSTSPQYAFGGEQKKTHVDTTPRESSTKHSEGNDCQPQPNPTTQSHNQVFEMKKNNLNGHNKNSQPTPKGGEHEKT